MSRIWVAMVMAACFRSSLSFDHDHDNDHYALYCTFTDSSVQYVQYSLVTPDLSKARSTLSYRFGSVRLWFLGVRLITSINANGGGVVYKASTSLHPLQLLSVIAPESSSRHGQAQALATHYRLTLL